METINERLLQYCTDHVKEVPYGAHLGMIGAAVANKVNELGKYDLVQKTETTQTIWVNRYPEELIPIVDEVIGLYFKDRRSLRTLAKAKLPATRYFNYDVEDYKAVAFEEALKKCGMEVIQNHVGNGIAQYKIPVSNPAHLVKLGKVFQKERWIQENKQRR